MSKHQNLAQKVTFQYLFRNFEVFVSATFYILCVNNECIYHFLQNIEEMGWIDSFLTEIWPIFSQN